MNIDFKKNFHNELGLFKGTVIRLNSYSRKIELFLHNKKTWLYLDYILSEVSFYLNYKKLSY